MQSLLDAIATSTPDIEVPYNPAEWKEPTNSQKFKVLTGNYRFTIAREDVEFRRNRDTKAIIADDGWPQLEIKKITITAPIERTLYIYATVRTKPYTRKDGTLGSDLIDWIRAYDATAEGLTSRDKQIAALERFLDDNAELVGRLDLEAFDGKYIDALKATGVQPNNDDYAKARVRGAKSFDEFGEALGPVHPDGTTQSELKARYRIAQFYSSLTAAGTRLAKA